MKKIKIKSGRFINFIGDVIFEENLNTSAHKEGLHYYCFINDFYALVFNEDCDILEDDGVLNGTRPKYYINN